MNNIQRWISILLPVLLLSVIVYYFSDLLAYFAMAWVLSLVGMPLKRFFLTIKLGGISLNNNIASVLALLMLVVAFLSLISIFAPQIITQTKQLANISLEEWITKLRHPIDMLGNWLFEKKFIAQPKDFENFLFQEVDHWFKPEMITQFFSSLLAFTGDFLVAFFSILFISFFFLKDDQLFLRALQSIVKSENEEKVKTIVVRSTYLLSRYFTGVLIQVSIITIILFLGLSILGIQNALLIAFFAAILNVVPYLGPLLGSIFAIFITITTHIDQPFDQMMLCLVGKVALIFVIVQLIDNFILQPYIFSTSIRAHPLEIFFVVLIAAKLAGIPGMVVAIPIYTVLRVVASLVLAESDVVKKITKSIHNIEEEE